MSREALSIELKEKMETPLNRRGSRLRPCLGERSLMMAYTANAPTQVDIRGVTNVLLGSMTAQKVV